MDYPSLRRDHDSHLMLGNAGAITVRADLSMEDLQEDEQGQEQKTMLFLFRYSHDVVAVSGS